METWPHIRKSGHPKFIREIEIPQSTGILIIREEKTTVRNIRSGLSIIPCTLQNTLQSFQLLIQKVLEWGSPKWEA